MSLRSTKGARMYCCWQHCAAEWLQTLRVRSTFTAAVVVATAVEMNCAATGYASYATATVLADSVTM